MFDFNEFSYKDKKQCKENFEFTYKEFFKVFKNNIYMEIIYSIIIEIILIGIYILLLNVINKYTGIMLFGCILMLYILLFLFYKNIINICNFISINKMSTKYIIFRVSLNFIKDLNKIVKFDKCKVLDIIFSDVFLIAYLNNIIGNNNISIDDLRKKLKK